MRRSVSCALESMGAGLERPGLRPGKASGVDNGPAVIVPRYYRYLFLCIFLLAEMTISGWSLVYVNTENLAYRWFFFNLAISTLVIVTILLVMFGEFSLSTGILASFSSEGDHPPMEEEKEVLLFRIAQEALANVRKHSRAKTVEVSLVSGNGDLRLSVRDDGDGFDAEKTPAGNDNGMRFGILGMRNRAEIFGGVLEILSKPGSGTTVTVQVLRE